MFTMCIVSAVIGFLIGLFIPRKPDSVEEHYDDENDFEEDGQVFDTSSWVFEDVPSQEEADEIAWLREQGLLPSDDVRTVRDLSRSVLGVERRPFGNRMD